MTRTDVEVGTSEVLDAFHDHDRDGDAVEVTVNDEPSINYHGEAGTISLDGYECDLEEHEAKGYDVEYSRVFKVYLNGEVVSEGFLTQRTSAAAVIETSGALIEVPPGQRVEIDIYGEEAD